MGYLLSYDNAVFSCYAFYAAILILKMFIVTFSTIFMRVKHKVFENPEDIVLQGVSGKYPPVAREAVDRTLRAHLNDLENIPLFLFIGLLYVLTDPSLGTARLYFRLFTAVRFLHTFIYLNAIPQPARGIAHGASLVLIVSLTLSVIKQAPFY